MLWTDKASKYLKKYWEINELKPKQIEVINALLLGNDVIGLLPTGYGKSMCYILPPLIKKKTMIIISPLISLMEDQTSSLKEKGVKCSALHSNNKNKDEEIAQIIDGIIRIVYMSPEYLVKGYGKELVEILIENNLLGFVAIDEAHCISNWSHDFRPDYKLIGDFRKLHSQNHIPIIALTATATDVVCSDISKCIGMVKPSVIKASFDRPNLYIKVSTLETLEQKVKNKKKMNIIIKADIVRQYIEKYKKHKIIVYINSKSDTEDLADELNTCGIITNAYHAGLTPKKRQTIHDAFSLGEVNIIISTIAFGMGIDQIVKCVIIFGCSSSIEENIQQCGRAGRDGLPGETIFYFEKGQFMLKKKLLQAEYKNDNLLMYKNDNLRKVWDYVYTTTCRRKHMLSYFNELTDYITCNNCDNCDQKLIDMTIPFSQIIMSEKDINTAYGKIIAKYNCHELTNLKNILWLWKKYVQTNKLDINKLDNKHRLKFNSYYIHLKPEETKKEQLEKQLEKYSKLY
jgi:RecQ family ATP-dependent DNA helicase